MLIGAGINAIEYRKNKRYIASIPHILSVAFLVSIRLKAPTLGGLIRCEVSIDMNNGD
jgi:hypothetical protein